MISSVTSEQLFFAGVGIAAIVLNKPFARLLIWWEQEIVKINDPLNPWIYRIFIIGMGGLFLSIAYIK